jgi:hypothetical protein
MRGGYRDPGAERKGAIPRSVGKSVSLILILEDNRLPERAANIVHKREYRIFGLDAPSVHLKARVSLSARQLFDSALHSLRKG